MRRSVLSVEALRPGEDGAGCGGAGDAPLGGHGVRGGHRGAGGARILHHDSSLLRSGTQWRSMK